MEPKVNMKYENMFANLLKKVYLPPRHICKYTYGKYILQIYLHPRLSNLQHSPIGHFSALLECPVQLNSTSVCLQTPIWERLIQIHIQIQTRNTNTNKQILINWCWNVRPILRGRSRSKEGWEPMEYLVPVDQLISCSSHNPVRPQQSSSPSNSTSS